MNGCCEMSVQPRASNFYEVMRIYLVKLQRRLRSAIAQHIRPFVQLRQVTNSILYYINMGPIAGALSKSILNFDLSSVTSSELYSQFVHVYLKITFSSNST